MRKVGYLLDQIRLHGETPELVEEVKRLAKRHGLVTPYTSFLVVEDGEVRRTGGARPDDTPRRAPEEGAGADHERLKRRIREMEEASAETFRRAESGAAAQDASRLADSYKRGGRPGKGGAPVPASRPDPASVTLGGEIDAPGVTRMKRRQVGGKTFFLRDGAWIDSVLDAAGETGGPDRKVVEVAFMSEAYFALLREHPELGPYLALGENVVVEAGGVVYKVIRADE
jgi:Ca-activated chloride channel family protein